MTQVFVSCDECVARSGAVDARENGTTDQCTRATKNDARAEASNMELTDLVTRELGSAGNM